MQPRSGTVHINKIAAASRQLDAAIRMFFTKEDDLAVHTVASAAFRILRDLLDKRDNNLTSEVLQHGIYELAQQYTEGRLPKHTLKLIQNTPLLRAIEEIAGQGEKFNVSSIRIPMNRKQEQRAWPSKAAAFLKHADRDCEDHLSADEIKNEHVLIGACIAYLKIMKIPTPEIVAFVAFWAAKNGADVADDAQKLLLKLKSAQECDRYQLCAKFIRDAKYDRQNKKVAQHP